jgi:hypothetical protein
LDNEEFLEEENDEIVLATIAAVDADGVTIEIGGNGSAGQKKYKVNAAQKFAAGDRVKIHKDSGTYLVEYVIGNPMSKYPIPAGGTDGYVLMKDGSDDFAVKWADGRGMPSGGSANQVLIKNSNTNYDVSWATKGFLPVEGTAGQVLAKKTATNYDVQWVNANGLPPDGSTGQFLKKDSNTNYDVSWADAPHELPTGGSANQVLTKNSTTNYDVKWANAPSPSSITNGSYTVSVSNGYFCPSNGSITLGSFNGYWNGCYIKGAIRLGGSSYDSTLGFFGTTPQSKKTVGSSGTLASLISALQGYGLIS